MKKIIAVIFILGMWYFSGMYRHPAIMAVSLGATAVVAILLIVALVLRGCLSVDIPAQEQMTYKGLEKKQLIRAINKINLPINRFRVSLMMKYPNTRKKYTQKLYSSALGKRQNSDNLSEFYFTAPYCGTVELTLKRLTVFDWLSVFSFDKRLKESQKIYVLPMDREIKINLPANGVYLGEPLTSVSMDSRGEDYSEVRLIREYRPDDLYRHIHHNYSAKTDTLWVKEYQRETDLAFDLTLNTASEVPMTVEQLDALYDISCSVMCALLRKNAILYVHWYNKKLGAMESTALSDILNVKELMVRLYNADLNHKPQEQSGMIPKKGMVIDTNLRWTFGDTVIYQFSLNQFDKELMSCEFDIPMQ